MSAPMRPENQCLALSAFLGSFTMRLGRKDKKVISD